MLQIANFRRYFTGQAVSLSGSWMQSVGQAWLVVELTRSGTSLGLVVAVQTLPILVLGPYCGLVADRFDRRRLLLVTSGSSALVALTLGLLTVTSDVRLWMIFLCAAALGSVMAVDQPARSAFVAEMVGTADIRSAVTLIGVLVAATRVVGPAIAGVLITSIGIGFCFLVNAASYVPAIIAFATIAPDQLHRDSKGRRVRRQVRDGLRYAIRQQDLRTPLLVMAVVGTFAYEFQVVLPLVARYAFDGSGGAYGAMTAAMGLGAVGGGLVAAGRRRSGRFSLAVSTGAFGLALLAAAAAPALPAELVCLMAVGALSVTFLSLAESGLQMTVRPEMRGRVMALWSIGLLGTTPIGGPVTGFVSQHAGPRYGLALGAAACLVAAAGAAVSASRSPAPGPQLDLDDDRDDQGTPLVGAADPAADAVPDEVS
ncbi:MAG: MFS transporter [Actinomycetota bacterium]|nr:MFS transporter [Actinomycetota bacterium]